MCHPLSGDYDSLIVYSVLVSLTTNALAFLLPFLLARHVMQLSPKGFGMGWR